MGRTYTEVSRLRTLEERFEYLALSGEVGCVTFGSSRMLNQAFYNSREWRDLRHAIIFRDGNCDLGVEGFEIGARPIIHHINPLTEAQIENRDRALFDPNNLITTTHNTHNAIHYGDARLLPQAPVERFANDTAPWRL